MGLYTRRSFGLVETNFTIGRASGALTGANQGVALSVVAGDAPLMLTHIIAQMVSYQSTTLNFVRCLVLNGDVPADVTPLQQIDTSVAGYTPPANFASSVAGSPLWESFAMMGNTSNSSTSPTPNIKQDFTFGPVVQPGEILSVLAFPMINSGAADFTSKCWMMLSVWGRTLSAMERGLSGGDAGNVRALPRGLAGR